MALVKWLSKVSEPDLTAVIEAALTECELEIDRSVSSSSQVYAADPSSRPLREGPRVSVLISWTDQRNHEAQVEVRSDEPMLSRGTRCEAIASHIRSRLP